MTQHKPPEEQDSRPQENQEKLLQVGRTGPQAQTVSLVTMLRTERRKIMYPFQGMKNSMVRLAIVVVMGLAVAIGSPFTVDAKEKISKRALKEMIVGAKTAADHKAIADYYYAEAAKARAKADEHDQMALAYEKAGVGKYGKSPSVPFTHCQNLVQKYKSLADDLTALAKVHEAMAAKTQ